jgi:hypothetical protein
MVSKIIMAGMASILLMGGSVGVAQAYDWGNTRSSTLEVTVENEDTTVRNTAVAKSNTGDNAQEINATRTWFSRQFRIGSPSTQLIETGNASADALADSVVNETYMQVDGSCVTGCVSEMAVRVGNDDTNLFNDAIAGAETGDNHQDINTARRASTQITRTGGSTAIGTSMARVNMTDLRISR